MFGLVGKFFLGGLVRVALGVRALRVRIDGLVVSLLVGACPGLLTE